MLGRVWNEPLWVYRSVFILGELLGGKHVEALPQLRANRVKECYERLMAKSEGGRVGNLAEPCHAS